MLPQRSADLSGWTPVGVTDEIDSDLGSTAVRQCRRAYVAVTPGSPLFLRLKAQL